MKVAAYAARDSKSPLAPFQIERRPLGPKDIEIQILFCGVCHSDLHMVRNEWNNTTYPVVPGHEIVGRVISTGKEVTSLKAGDRVAVGCMVDSCRSCSGCKEGLQQYCEVGGTFTYNSPEKQTGGITYGGYSTKIVVDQDFVIPIPTAFKESDLPGVAPLLCAGITTYSPLRHWGVGPGKKVGVVGLGGLGHMAVKLAHAMGAHVVLFTTSAGKLSDAKRLGADEAVISSQESELQKHQNSFDFILNTVAAPHSLDLYLSLLKRDGTICMVGLPDKPHPSPNISALIFRRKQIAGSLIGGIQETKEMLDFCAQQGITSDIEIIHMEAINDAYKRMLKSDVRYRFVIDLQQFA